MAPLKKRWTAQATISIADDIEMLQAAANAGCYGLLIGIENVTDEGFRKYKKSKYPEGVFFLPENYFQDNPL